MVSMINLGCTLTLQGKCYDLQGGTFRLDEAVDTFRALLAEPKLMEFPYERAIVHINLAEALSSMGELAFPHQRTEYLESAVGALATALSLVAPRVWRALVLVHPASFV
jgi:hypothetical protein